MKRELVRVSDIDIAGGLIWGSGAWKCVVCGNYE